MGRFSLDSTLIKRHIDTDVIVLRCCVCSIVWLKYSIDACRTDRISTYSTFGIWCAIIKVCSSPWIIRDWLEVCWDETCRNSVPRSCCYNITIRIVWPTDPCAFLNVVYLQCLNKLFDICRGFGFFTILENIAVWRHADRGKNTNNGNHNYELNEGKCTVHAFSIVFFTHAVFHTSRSKSHCSLGGRYILLQRMRCQFLCWTLCLFFWVFVLNHLDSQLLCKNAWFQSHEGRPSSAIPLPTPFVVNDLHQALEQWQL